MSVRRLAGVPVSTRYASGRRYASRPAQGKTITNRFPGTCASCSGPVPAGTGLAIYRGSGWTTEHRPMVWHGSPVSGGWVDGCPGDTRPDGATVPGPVVVDDVATGHRARAGYGRGYGRCEDAPCCGCCD